LTICFGCRLEPSQKKKKNLLNIEANNITCYLPLTKSVKRYGRKTVEFYPPMFQGYIFCQLDHDLYKLLVRSHGVFFKVNIDEVLEVQLIKDLNGIKSIEKVSTKKEIVIKPELVEGEQIIITDGPMQGTSGVITRRANDIIITVNVDILGQSVSVKMDIGEVELEK
jgi:transcription antitermination factor NusG